MKTPHGLACGKAALTLQRKGKKAWQVKVCLALFFVGNMKDSSRKRLRPKTAQVSRAEKRATVSQRQPFSVKHLVMIGITSLNV